HILTTTGRKLMLLGITYYCQLKVNAARVDGKEIIITESSVRRDLRLAVEKGVDCLPNSTIFENLELMRNPKRNNTQVPQPSGSTKHVADEAVYKELDDNLKIKTTQALEITSLKRRVKEFDKKQRSRTHKLKKLYKVGLTARVDSSEDEQSLGKNTSKQGRKIHDTDANKDITLVNAQDDADDAKMNPKRNNTQVPQPSGSTKHVADEAVYKELDDNLVRAATTASSLEAEQDSDNIAKTQSKAIPNEASSLRTTTSGGP
nr:hypothetical protein [Tanacetum cinerariifolium]